jgi:hypothetical protein
MEGNGESETGGWSDCFCVWEGILVRMAATHNDHRALRAYPILARTQAGRYAVYASTRESGLHHPIPSHPIPIRPTQSICSASKIASSSRPLPRFPRRQINLPRMVCIPYHPAAGGARALHNSALLQGHTRMRGKSSTRYVDMYVYVGSENNLHTNHYLRWTHVSLRRIPTCQNTNYQKSNVSCSYISPAEYYNFVIMGGVKMSHLPCPPFSSSPAHLHGLRHPFTRPHVLRCTLQARSLRVCMASSVSGTTCKCTRRAFGGTTCAACKGRIEK